MKERPLALINFGGTDGGLAISTATAAAGFKAVNRL